MRFLTLDDVEVKGKVVIVRVDINSPIDPQTGDILDDTRIRESAPTIRELADRGAKVVVLAHQGRPEDPDFTTLEKHAKKLSEVLGKDVKYAPDLVGPTLVEKIKQLKPGEIMLAENVRMLAEEVAKLPPEKLSKTFMVKYLASVGEIFVNDAFAAIHRASPSLVGLAEVLPTYAGRLMERELRGLARAVTPEHPCLYVLGGAKFDDSVKITERVRREGIADLVLTGGLVGQAFLVAAGVDLGEKNEQFIRSKGYDKIADKAKKIVAEYGDRVLVPIDYVVKMEDKPRVLEFGVTTFKVGEIAALVSGGKRVKLPEDMPIYDIGPKTVEAYRAEIMKAKTVVANGPLGAFEEPGFEKGSFGILKAMAESPAFTVIGGGHIVAAAHACGAADGIKHVSTGGGATISLLTGEPLPVVEALTKAAQRVK
ncbi:MAG: phosphoglycerate kinase [Candidatus Hadarchaeales archaeon]